MRIDPQQLLAILPAAKSRVHIFCEPLNNAWTEFGVDTAHEIASFLAQIGHESMQLQALEENLNYGAKGLAATWARFSVTGKRGGSPNLLALEVQRKPERIANIVYANRMDNGDEDSGDGWRYRGRGLIHLTFKRNHQRCGDYLGLDLVGNPSLLLNPVHAARAAGWYWKVNGLDAYDDDDDARSESRIVNGGEIGLADRQEILDRALEVLA